MIKLVEHRLNKQLKPNYSPEIRNVCVEVMEREMNNLITESKDSRVKGVMLKQSVKVNSDRNAKA